MLGHFRYILLYFIAITTVTTGRKYDIHEESYKLYGEDFNSVLQKFRRTPEYMKILNLKMADLKKRMTIIQFETFMYYVTEMEKKIIEIFGGNTTLRSFDERPFWKQNQGGLIKPRPIIKFASKSSGINVLDDYTKFHSLLTFEETKRMQELGHEYFGLYLHDAMANMAPEDNLPESTKMPHDGEQPLLTTTEHNHVVTKQTTEIDEPSSSTNPPDKEQHSTAAPESIRHFRSPNI